jgi:low affinity Fe/Cu permease
MIIFIQHAQHRDTQALQGKLDELLRVHGEARLIKLDQKQPEEIEQKRENVSQEARRPRPAAASRS